MKNLIWFRRDLRINDNPALFHACQDKNAEVLAVFIATPVTWEKHNMSAAQKQFVFAHLHELKKNLETLGIPLCFFELSDFDAIPNFLENFISEQQIDALHFNHQYEWDERQRDLETTTRLQKKCCSVNVYHDQMLLPPEQLRNQQGEPYKVFTPFKKNYVRLLQTHHRAPYPKPVKREKNLLSSKQTALPNFSFEDQKQWPIGEAAAINRLRNFSAKKIQSYAKLRDYPSLDATSQLSPYLAIGVLSPHQCLARLLADGHSMDSTWFAEIIWREFYKMIMFEFPRVSRNRAFRIETDNIIWKKDDTLFQAWCAGQTGFPIIDAAMRQLNQTAWMHNRLRMLTAQFLSKLLWLDWRLGERYFSEHLIDVDLSANNGGWQWCASTGTDAAPYFRVFNPITQSEKFDADGAFIRHYCPELAHLDNKTIHDPYARGVRVGSITYPKKIIDYPEARLLAIQGFKELK